METLYPLLLAWRQPRLSAGGEGTFKPRCLLGELLASDSPLLPREGPGNGSEAEPLSCWVPLAQEPGLEEGSCLPPCPGWQSLKSEKPQSPRTLGDHLGWWV